MPNQRPYKKNISSPIKRAPSPLKNLISRGAFFSSLLAAINATACASSSVQSEKNGQISLHPATHMHAHLSDLFSLGIFAPNGAVVSFAGIELLWEDNLQRTVVRQGGSPRNQPRPRTETEMLIALDRKSHPLDWWLTHLRFAAAQRISRLNRQMRLAARNNRGNDFAENDTQSFQSILLDIRFFKEQHADALDHVHIPQFSSDSQARWLDYISEQSAPSQLSLKEQKDALPLKDGALKTEALRALYRSQLADWNALWDALSSWVQLANLASAIADHANIEELALRRVESLIESWDGSQSAILLRIGGEALREALASEFPQPRR